MRWTTATSSTARLAADVVPDPRSRRQPHGVHERSRTFDPAAHAWSDEQWTGRQLAGSVIYELHVGTFTPEGTLDAAIDKLDHLKSIGVDFVELLPVNAFNGEHGWGYDGVAWFAVHEPYGGPGGLPAVRRRLPRRRAGRRPGRGLQPPRPVGQLPADVRAVPLLGGLEPVGRPREPRRRGQRGGPRLHPRQRADVAGGLPRRRAAARRRARARGRLGDPPARGDGGPGRRGCRPPSGVR